MCLPRKCLNIQIKQSALYFFLIFVFFTAVINFLFQEVDEETPNSISAAQDFVPYRTGTTYRAKQIRIRFEPRENDIRRIFEASFYAGMRKLCRIHFHAF